MNNTATREELKTILDEWIPKYIRQVVELRSGSRLSAERYNELMNLLITQGDDTIELAQVVKQYVELLVNELSNSFVETTENVTAIAEGAVDTAEDAVEDVIAYKESMDARLEEALKEVEDSLTAAEDVISSAAEIYDKVDEINTTTKSIKDGTTQVGNAKTLDGHGAEYFFPKSGGTINGDVNVANIEEAVRLTLRLQNRARQIINRVYEDGIYRLYDMTNSKDIINSTADGTNTFNGTASGNLPLSGGRLSKNKIIALEIENTAGNASVIDFYGADGRMGAIGFNGKNVPIYQPSEGGANTLLHTGNKPTGTYTGNGSATNRQIAVGGVSKALMIKRTGSGIVLVDQYSAYGITPSGVVSFTKAELNFTNGVLYMGTANEIVNVSGGDYDYYSL